MPYKAIVLAGLLVLAGVALADSNFREGADYERLAPAQPTGAPVGRVEVVEAFQYGCSGCFRFEPYLEQWAETKPDYVDLVRVPVIWSSLGELHARAFYTAEALGMLDKTHAPFFRSVHVEGNHLETVDAIRKLFAAFGVSAQAFDAAFDSFAVNAKVQRAKELANRYDIRESPTVVVNGKYVTRASLSKSYDRWFEIVDDLAARERAGGAD
jgi:thiol:disulfide interchange protein DsbA